MRFSVRLKEDELAMRAGKEVAYDEFKLDWPSAPLVQLRVAVLLPPMVELRQVEPLEEYCHW